MAEKYISQELRLKNIDETKNCFVQETAQNELISKKHKKFETAVNCAKHFLILLSAVNGCISVSAFASVLGIPLGITSSVIGLKMYAITGEIKKYKSIIKETKKKNAGIVRKNVS